MVLLLAVAAGLVIGIVRARIIGQTYQITGLRLLWLAGIAFLPQLLFLYLPAIRSKTPTAVLAASLIVSQLAFLIFAWANRKLGGMSFLIIGLLLNLLVITANGGGMPIAPQTAQRLVSQDALPLMQSGDRFGLKDILLPEEETRLAWLSDRLLPPDWLPYQVAFSLGDIFIAAGAFWLLVTQGNHPQIVPSKELVTQ
jgi:hypothetical protein